jgi:methylthioribose-1-phosphate isomerase
MNLVWGVDRVLFAALKHDTCKARVKAALEEALAVAEEEAINCQKIGEYGLPLIQEISRQKKGAPVNILTHCNAGWLACIEYGTATAPIYTAFDNHIDVHVWVDETRPLNQGARLTAWELGKHGVSHTIITDNAGGHLMQHGMVDIVIVGTDRTTKAGDVANKIGTYLKALAAKDNDIPFYVALPSSTFDWDITDGIADIPIEERDPDEIRYVQGLCHEKIQRVLVPPVTSMAANHAFDVTPARLVTGFITERGVCRASQKDIMSLFPDKKSDKRV